MRITYDAVLASSDEEFLHSMFPALKKFSQVSFSVIHPGSNEFRHILQDKKIDILIYDPLGPDDMNFFTNHLKNSINYIILIHANQEFKNITGTKIVSNLVKPVKAREIENSIQKIIEFLSREEIFNNDYRVSILIKDVLKNIYSLSPTESSICISIAEGKGVNDILNIYGISINTYKTHMKNIYKKTIDRNISPGTRKGKLSQLLWFLMNLRERRFNIENNSE